MKRLFLALLLTSLAYAQGTQVWQQSTYDDFSKGTSHGVSISSDGTLTPASALKTIFESPSTFIWGLAVDKDSTAYLAAGQPARVYRVTQDGKATVVLAPAELQVQAVVLAPDGALYAATAPDGKIYKITRNSSSPSSATTKNDSKKTSAATTTADATKDTINISNDPNYTSSIFFDPKTKYIWALSIDKDGNLFAATGDQGEIFKINPKGEGSVWFKSDDTHIRSMLLAPDGIVYAGTDSTGLIYRITTGKDGKGEGFVLYSANKKEVTALALNENGTLYAAAVGDKKPTNQLPGFPFPQPASSGAPSALTQNTPIATFSPISQATGSEVYRIPKDGAPERLWSSKDELVYTIFVPNDSFVEIGLGNKGRILSIGGSNSFIEINKVSALQVTGIIGRNILREWVITSNPGKLVESDSISSMSTSYESDVFDAHGFSKWGHLEIRGHNASIATRSGNVENPDRNWSKWESVDLDNEGQIKSPPARFLQWSVGFVSPFVRSEAPVKPEHINSRLESVKVNYLTQNVAPVVEDVVVQTNAKVNSTLSIKPPETVNINLTPAPGAPPAPVIPKFEPPLNAQKERGAVTVRWAAHDDNDDQLIYTVLVRGTDDNRWLPLKDKITDKFVSFDSSTLPDGAYIIRIIASDAPSHTPTDAMTGSHDSALFEIDTTPPRVEALKVESSDSKPNSLHVIFTASDDFSNIQRAEVSIDGGDWQLVEPVGKISDSKKESYDFTLSIAEVKISTTDQTNKPGSSDTNSEHIVIVRVFDRFENMGTAKSKFTKSH